MIIRENIKVMFSNGEKYPAVNFERYLGHCFEFDCNGTHYYVRTHYNRQFETLIGTWDDEEKEYNYKKSEDVAVTKVIRCEEFIDDYAGGVVIGNS